MMPKLPKNLNNRFSFYLNYLPYIEPLGFWGGLVAGITLLIYAVTRATLKMSLLAKNSHLLELNYGRDNLLQVNQNGVYKPCEMKLITSNEKSNTILGNSGHEMDNVYTELQPDLNKLPNNVRSKIGSFSVELEPALDTSTDSSSCDEGHESDTATLTLSRNSSSPCCQSNNIRCVEALKRGRSNSNTATGEYGDYSNDDAVEQQVRVV